MSPEQTCGRAVDKRADIWAFGCLVYEMLAGRRAFDRGNSADTAAAVVGDEPDWARLPEDLPATLRPYLRRCLHSDPKERVQDMGDRLALAGAFDEPLVQSGARLTTDASAARMFGRGRGSGDCRCSCCARGGTTAWILKPAPGGPRPQTKRFAVAAAPSAPLAIAFNNRDLALTPDGTRLVYFAGEVAIVTSTCGSFARLTQDPFAAASVCSNLSSHRTAGGCFNDESDFTLTKVSITGGPAIPMVSVGTEILGASWGPDDTIVFARNGTGLWAVPSTGGTPKAITTLNKEREEVSHRWPEFLPGGKDVLFTIMSDKQADSFQLPR